MSNNKTKKCVGKESFQRMNYLYQLSNSLATESQCNNTASLFYSNLLINISKKTVQRLDINLKRTICKTCRCLLIAGITGKVRVKKNEVRWTCLKCNERKIFQINKSNNYIPWTQSEESVVDTLDYSDPIN